MKRGEPFGIPGLDVSRETIEKLAHYEQLIRKWNPAINLVSKSSLHDLWERHITDSAQIFPHIPKHAIRCLDIGSGGGLPAIVLAILSVGAVDERNFTLVESDQRKATFLREAARILDLKIEVHSIRVEALGAFGADLITARALAPLSKLLASIQLHLSTDGICLFPKGESYRDEISDAYMFFSFEYETIPSLTDPRGAILKIHGIRNA